MGGFIDAYQRLRELRNLLLIIYSIGAFALIYYVTNLPNTKNIPVALALIFFLIVFVISTFRLLPIDSSMRGLNSCIVVLSIYTLGFSVILAILSNDSNIITGGATLILVAFTAYNIRKTGEIAEKSKDDPN